MTDTTIEIVCDNCTHRIRYHAAGQFGCVVPGCKCSNMEPVEKEIDVKDQHDIIKIKHDMNGKLVVVDTPESELEN